MNTIEMLFQIVPIFSAILSTLAAIFLSFIRRRLFKTEKEKNIYVKINDKEISVNGYTEQEIIDLLNKLNSAKTVLKDEMPSEEKQNQK